MKEKKVAFTLDRPEFYMDDSSFSNVSVVIPHRNQSANLSNMLAILERQSLTPDKIVVVDDASSSVELDRISKHFKNQIQEFKLS